MGKDPESKVLLQHHPGPRRDHSDVHTLHHIPEKKFNFYKKKYIFIQFKIYCNFIIESLSQNTNKLDVNLKRTIFVVALGVDGRLLLQFDSIPATDTKTFSTKKRRKKKDETGLLRRARYIRQIRM